jgi:hypothetical protein
MAIFIDQSFLLKSQKIIGFQKRMFFTNVLYSQNQELTMVKGG